MLFRSNYDSFTFNLYQYIGTFTQDIKVVRNDKITIGEIRELHPDKIVLSPGPKSPKEAGICMDVVKEFYREIPILGICLGHQCIGEAFGGTVTYAKALFHGKQSEITHTGTGIFAEQILVLDDGKIVGKGTHEELLKNCETYQQIARSQLSAKELGIEESEVSVNE